MTPTLGILITGAAQRIGLHCALQFIAQGQAVIAEYRTARPGIESLRQAGATVLYADFSTVEGFEAFVAELKATTTHLRAIIHSASTWRSDQPGGAQKLAVMLAVHVQAPYLINLACDPMLRRGCPADIVHISDDTTRKVSARHLEYCASKAVMESLTLSFAAQLSPGIKVNTLALAMVMFNEVDNTAYRERTMVKNVLAFEPGPQVVYESLRYLLDNPYVTGTRLAVNGSRHMR
jgi:dihydromonapterin reductase / dihydrofolate reductase